MSVSGGILCQSCADSVFRTRYLLLIAALILVLNIVNTTGEYVLGHLFLGAAGDALASGAAGDLTQREYLGSLYADFHSLVNGIALVAQLFLVSRIFRWVGVRGAILFLPVVALSGNLLVSAGAALAAIRVTKALENGLDYSLMNTVRHALFLVTDRASKYKAKATIDTFFVRSGDVVSAGVVFLGAEVFSWATKGFGAFNVLLIVVWLGLAVWIGREHRRLESRTG